ncbi:prolyl oligopeptidase family protein [Shewanella intestini]
MNLFISAFVFCALTTGCMENTLNTPTSFKVKSADVNEHLLYPQTVKSKVVDSYFDEKVADPYRWLEDDLSQETANWVNAQNTVTANYLAQIPYRDSIKKRLSTLWNYEKVSAPFKEGEYTYFYKNDGLQNQFVLYQQKENGKADVFLDPNQFSEDGSTSLSYVSFSKDGSLAAYAISEGGSDWRKIFIIDVETKKQLEAPLENIKFSAISWYKNEGIYYSSYEKPKGSELSAKTDQHRLFYHKLGQVQKDDLVIYGDTPQQKHRYVVGRVTKDDRYLLINGAMSTSGNDLYLKDLTKPNSPLMTLRNNFDADTDLIDSEGDTLYFVTNLNAPNKKVVVVDATSPGSEHWQDLIPETEHVLSISKAGGFFFTEYMVDGISKVYQYDYEGNKVRTLALPGVGNTSSIQGREDDKTLYYSFNNYKTPPTIYSYNPENGLSEVYKKSGSTFNSDAFESKQVFFKSKDGTSVPMIITYKKGVALNGKNPTLLYAYGGFNTSLTPRYRPIDAVWMELGGIYAVANIRGGGEYGKKWHHAGIQFNKQNVFDDFIAAAEYLIAEKYTSSDYLAINGVSNGGLLVGAVMTQRPDLMQVAIPAVGVLDMLRYHKFTSGAGWAYDYGTSEQSKEMFEYLKDYSPLHNVKDGVNYPATMITTADHDDRVVPAHSFKFAAELQAKQGSHDPVLIRIETNAGHGAGIPVAKTIDLYADIYSFILFNMGMTTLEQ